MGWGSSTGRGGGRKVRPWVWKKGIWDVPGKLPGCPGPLRLFKKFVQKRLVRIYRSPKFSPHFLMGILVELYTGWHRNPL